MKKRIRSTAAVRHLGRRRRNLFPALALCGAVLVSSVTAVLLLEIGLRLTGAQSDFFYQPDASIGATLIPGKRGWYRSPTGPQWIEVNSRGFRDVEWSSSRHPGKRRIAVLGDSFTEAMQVSASAVFSRRMESLLLERCPGGQEYEVLNFGVSGFGTGQELETLRQVALELQPDLVLFYFYPSNDLYDNSRELDVEPNRLHFELSDEGELVRLPFTINDNVVKRWLRHHSRTYLFLRERLLQVAAARSALDVLGAVQPQALPEDKEARRAVRAVQNNRYRVPLSAPLERSWELTKALLAEARASSQARGAQFGVVVIPNIEEITDRSTELVQLGPGQDLQQSLEKAGELCAELGLHCLRLVEVFRDAGLPIERFYFLDDGHWTATGHEVVAEATTDWLAGWYCI